MGAGAISSLALMRSPLLAAETRSEPVTLAPGPQLFLDEYLIASQISLKRVINVPSRLPRPIVTGAEDQNFQPYVSVIRDPKSRRFRMWYNVPIDSGQSHIGHIESEDGIHWIRPHRVLTDPHPISFGASVLDEGPDFPDPGRRFKLATEKSGLWIAFSSDGLTWTSARSERVLDGIGDIVSLSRDALRNRYLLTCKAHSVPEDGYKGGTQNSSEGVRRLVGQTVSEDCIHWTPVKRIILADDRDEGITEFYSIGGVIARGGLLIGLLKVLRDDLPHEPDAEVHGIGYTCLAWTRDGENWERDREPIIPRNPEPGTWDRAMVWGDCQLPVGDELYVYYGGYARGHKVERFKERQIGLARMKLDRYVSRDAGAGGGSLRTPPFAWNGLNLTVNAQVGGELRARLLDKSGAPLPGFGDTDCQPVKGDSLAHPLKWRMPLASLQGSPVQLEFLLSDARLYGFELT